MRITVQQLRYFLKTAEIGSVSKAAQALNISQSTLSEALTQVESAAGFEILSRSRKGVTPTAPGNEFLEYAQRVVADMDALETRFFDSAHSENRFGVASASFGFAWEALLKVSRFPENKKYETYWYLDVPTQIVKHINAGDAEIGLLNLIPGNERSTIKVVEDADFEFHELLRAPLYAMMNPSHPLASKKSVTDEELSNYPFFSVDQYVQQELSRRAPCANNNKSSKPLGSRGAESELFGIKAPNGVLISPAQLVQSIANVNGYTIWCRFLPNSFTRDEVVSMPVETPNRLCIGYVCRKDQQLSRMAQQLIDAIREFGAEGSRVPDRLSSRPYID